MKTSTYLRLAWRDMDIRLAAFYIIILALSAAAVCYAAAIRLSVAGEKSEPCELTVIPQGQSELTDESVSEIWALDDVAAATGRLEFTASVSSGDYSTTMQFIGIDGAYLEADYTTGGMFPASSSMPWVILTLPAAKTFTDPNDTAKHDADYIPPINWLEAVFTVQLGLDQVPARVSGIMDTEECVGYLDLSTAKHLLQQHGMPSSYTSVAVRIVNIGAAHSVSREITALGYQVSDNNDGLRQKWDVQLRESVYILLLAAALLLCAILIRTIAGIKDTQRNGAWYRELLWMGMSCWRLKRLLMLRWVGLDLVGGILLGVAVAYALPLFVESEASQSYTAALSLPQICIASLLYILIGLVSSDRLSRNSASIMLDDLQ